MLPGYDAMTFIVAGAFPKVRLTHDAVDGLTLGLVLYCVMESLPVVVQLYVICCGVPADAGTVLVIFLP